MDDKEIIDLYLQRNQDAIAETDRKYGGLCKKFSYGILSSWEDVEECVFDTYMALWNSIPPQVPVFLKAYILRILRNFSLMRVRDRCSVRHGGGELALVLDELGDICDPSLSPADSLEQKEFLEVVNRFLRTLPETERNIFLCRYYFVTSIGEIAEKLGCSQSKVKTSLYRTRKKLLTYLKKEDLI